MDVFITAPAAAAMMLYQVSTLGTLAVIMGVRLVVWMAALWALFAPVRTWQQHRRAGRRVEDPVLVEADASLHRAPIRFVQVYAGTWVVSFVAMMLVADVPATRPSQQVAASFIGLSIVLASFLLIPIFRYTLDGLYRTVAGELLARGIRPARPRTPVVKGIVLLFLLLMLGAMIGLGGATVGLASDSLTNNAIAEQHRLIELDAQRFELVAELPAAGEVELLALDGLPPALAQRDEDVRMAFDPARDEVVAAARLSDGRWILRRGPHHDFSWGLGLISIISAVLTVIPSILAGVALNRVVLQPLMALEQAANSIAEEGRLLERERIVAPFDDEIGDVGHSFNAMLDMLEQLASAAGSVSQGDLRVDLEGRGDLHDAFRDMIAKLDEIVIQIRMTSLEVASAAAEIQAASEEQEMATEQQVSSVRQVGATVATLAISAEAITNAARGVLDNAEQTRTTTADTTTRIAALRSQSEGISELLELIREVADRSDLLALNGSLEAVRAGESGRGFALVAAEMRRLAERVTLSVDDVAEQLGRIQTTSDGTVAATQRSHALAGHTTEAADAITRETESQSAAMDELSTTIEQVAEIAVATSRATGHTRATAEGLRLHAEQLERLTAHFSTKDA